MIRRWLKFNTVGAMGIAVQLAALAILKGWLQIDYLAATAVAVEIAVLHNFLWHERWTWRERSGRGVLARLLAFHLTNGTISLVCNLLIMRLLVGRWHVQYLAANLGAIAAGSLANFALAEWFVFRCRPRRALPGPPVGIFGNLTPTTAAAAARPSIPPPPRSAEPAAGIIRTPA